MQRCLYVKRFNCYVWYKVYLTILSFRDVFQSMGITAYDLTVDMLDMHADKRTFHRSACSTVYTVSEYTFLFSSFKVRQLQRQVQSSRRIQAQGGLSQDGQLCARQVSILTLLIYGISPSKIWFDRYFARLLKEVIAEVDNSKYQCIEPRLSIYGR
jgi:AMP deaminase